ncbi:MAG: hypothetical protein GWN18_16005, partial [Thermoplasmata archaeon]|nr:hypothetical protein [Thermoplasmata archaeon]NIS13576.1 hypothetical protein [Thermoplasmata archaeon]NIS21444.1 hypothetical protein [Thermoplasmata archaeon]NIT79006.1 hypothetical protein [Thermoplasmata archaeon]NIU50496.1 hypothetical protein [Thermoplasmata archaeon]
PLADDPNLDVLGIDIYWDQWLGLFSICMPWRMGRLSREVGKPWWLVETAGAYGLGGIIKTPSCRKVRRNAERCRRHGAQVLGFYRLWGDYGGLLDPASDYNIFTEPGNAPVETKDGRGRVYWRTIRDL